MGPLVNDLTVALSASLASFLGDFGDIVVLVGTVVISISVGLMLVRKVQAMLRM